MVPVRSGMAYRLQHYDSIGDKGNKGKIQKSLRPPLHPEMEWSESDSISPLFLYIYIISYILEQTNYPLIYISLRCFRINDLQGIIGGSSGG